jgi:AcrR family transcriptional regulator
MLQCRGKSKTVKKTDGSPAYYASRYFFGERLTHSPKTNKVSIHLNYSIIMPRPSQLDEQRTKLLPLVCQAFSELGYRRATTAKIASRCGVRENILYRLWSDKKAMFLASLDNIFQRRAEIWREMLSDSPNGRQLIKRLVEYEAEHQGEFGFYRVVFTALTETDDAAIRTALRNMYRRFHRLVCNQLSARDQRGKKRSGLSDVDTAWGLIGLATISNIIRELQLISEYQRQRMFAAVAMLLVTEESH